MGEFDMPEAADLCRTGCGSLMGAGASILGVDKSPDRLKFENAGWAVEGNQYWRIQGPRVSWSAAEYECAQHGPGFHLGVPTDDKIRSALAERFKGALGRRSSGWLWLGATSTDGGQATQVRDLQLSAGRGNADGSVRLFQHRGIAARGACLAMKANGKLYLQPCADRYAFVCAGPLASRHRDPPTCQLRPGSEQPSVRPTRPNIILAMSDDQGWGDMPGHEHLRLPHLQAMQEGGLRFKQFYVAAPVCSPTRASVVTGRHPQRVGVPDVNANGNHGDGRVKHGLYPEDVTIAEALRPSCYRSGAFGKWHIGSVRDSDDVYLGHPGVHGFDEWLVTVRSVDLVDPNHYYDSALNGQRVGGRIPGDDNFIVANRTMEFIERALGAGRPFFAMAWFHAPHIPLSATKEYMEVGSCFAPIMPSGPALPASCQLTRLRMHPYSPSRCTSLR